VIGDKEANMLATNRPAPQGLGIAENLKPARADRRGTACGGVHIEA